MAVTGDDPGPGGDVRFCVDFARRVSGSGRESFCKPRVGGHAPAMSRAAIVGPGNIGTDLPAKLERSSAGDVAYMVEVVARASTGCFARIRYPTSSSRPPRRRRTARTRRATSARGRCHHPADAPRSLSPGGLRRRPDDRHRTGGVQHTVQPHRPEHGAGEPAAAPMPDHEQIGPPGLLHKHLGG